MIVIRKAIVADLDALHKISVDTFKEAYADRNTRDDIDYYNRTFFSRNIIKEELNETHTCFYVATENEDIVGYVKLSQKTVPQEVVVKPALEISRIYVYRSHYGKGLGWQLLRAGIDHAKSLGCKALYLAVWKENHRAVTFYQKCHFTVCGETTFDWGTGKIDEDYLMCLEI